MFFHSALFYFLSLLDQTRITRRNKYFKMLKWFIRGAIDEGYFRFWHDPVRMKTVWMHSVMSVSDCLLEAPRLGTKIEETSLGGALVLVYCICWQVADTLNTGHQTRAQHSRDQRGLWREAVWSSDCVSRVRFLKTTTTKKISLTFCPSCHELKTWHTL